MSSLKSFVLAAVVAAPALAVNTVDLLIDHGYASTGALNLRSVLSSVATRKGQTFHFGSTYDTYDADASWTANVFSTFFNHIVVFRTPPRTCCPFVPIQPSSPKTHFCEG